ncbi:MAG: ribonuclease Z [Bacteroidales bacterium]|jgi:ribonuclease Z|nr:ribonuclease Z [Bacteroidales bacterium]
MGFFVTVLGSGAAIPTGHRSCSAQVVNVEGFKILIDAGEGVQNQIRRSHVKMQSISTILISHLHGDHFFGLPGLVSSMHLCGRTEPLDIFAPQGLEEVLEAIFRVSNTQLNFQINYHTLSGDTLCQILENKKCKISSFPIYHSIETYGFIIEEEKKNRMVLRRNVCKQYNLTDDEAFKIRQGFDHTLPDGTVIPNGELVQPSKPVRRYAYCCDTSYSEALIPILKGVSMLCFDCTFDSKNADLAISKGHGTTVQAATLAKQSEVLQLLLTHFSARYKDITPLVDEAQAIFPNTIAASDLSVVDVPTMLSDTDIDTQIDEP